MILAIDVGNTNIVIGGCTENQVFFHERFPTIKTMTSEDFQSNLKSFFEIHPGEYEAACLCSVAPEINDAIVTGCQALGFKTLVVDTVIDTGITYKLSDSSDLGPDLIAGAAAAKELYSLPAVVIDTGTATTLMAVDSEGGLLGGAILPGIKTSFAALFSGASMLRHFEIQDPVAAIGRNTEEAISSGALYGYADMIDGLCQRFTEELGQSPAFILTGGLAYRLISYCKTDFIHDDMLVLKGICSIYNRNR